MPLFTRKDIPTFIYLIDDIIKHIEDDKENIYNTIAKKGSDIDNNVHERTIRRAFKLRESLKLNEFVIDGDKKLTLATLNVLTAYRYDHKPKRFKVLQKHNKSIIDKYYENNKPSDAILNELFKKKPKQISELENHKEELLSLLAELDHNSLDFFIKNWIDNYFIQKPENTDIEQLKNNLMNHIDSEIKKTEKKHKRILSLYHIFGSIALLFFSVKYYDDLKKYIIRSFIKSNNENQLINDDIEEFDDDDDDYFYDV